MNDRPAPPTSVVDVIRTDETFSALAHEWDDLVANSVRPSIFLTRPWLQAWRETIGADHGLVVATTRDPIDGLLTGVAPFAVESRKAAGVTYRALVFAGGGPLAPDHLDLVVRKGHEAQAAALWAATVRAGGWDLADLDGLRAGSLVARTTLRRHTDDRHVVGVEPCPYLPLPDSWEAYEALLGKNHRQNLRRYARKLDREAPAPVAERMVTNRAEVAPTIERLGDLHQAIRTAKGDAGSFHSPALRRFAVRAAEYLFDAGRLRLHRLDIGEDAVAVIWCMRQGDTVSFYSTGYDSAWSKYGPGRRIMAAAIRSAIEEGATEFDFLRGDEAYKEAWATRSRLDQRVVLPRSARGRMLWAMRSLRAGLRNRD